MSRIEKVTGIAAKLYEARRVMRSFWGERYDSKVEEYGKYIRAGMQKYECDELHSTMKIVALLQEKKSDSGMSQALILAAYAEMIDPSLP